MTQDYRNKIGEIIGEASMCWSETPTGVFDSDSAVKLIDKLETIFKEERNAVLSEVERQVEKHYVPDFDNNTIHQKDLQDVLNNLRVK